MNNMKEAKNMKMKQLLAWILVLVMCLSMAACRDADKPKSNTTTATATEETANSTETTAESTETDAAKPLLYKVTDADGNVVWLFGSIHVGREDYYPLPAYVLDAYEGADSLAVEADIIAFEKDVQQQVDALSCLVYRDRTTIKDHISQELYTKAVEVLKDLNTYMSALDLYCPAVWSSLIDSTLAEQLGSDANLGIDLHLLERAYTDKKQIIEIESAQFQYQMMADFSDELQAKLLEDSLEMYDNLELAKEDLNQLMDLWASGDEQAFAAYLASEDDDLTAEELPLYEEHNDAMIVRRNQSMTDYAENALKSGKEVFICVGAAHVVGNGAMAQLLAQRGYTVELITQ